MPVGGIGTGTIGFGGRGQLRDWETGNRPAKGALSPLTFLACRVAGENTPAVARLLEGDLFDEELGGEQGATAPLPGLPRFAGCEFSAAYPFGKVTLTDPAVPVRAEVEAWNPLIPGDEDDSGLPLAVLRVRLTSLAAGPLDMSVLMSVEGRAFTPEDGITGFTVSTADLDPAHEDYGTLAVAVLGEGTWTGQDWAYGKWNQGLQAMWHGFLRTGRPAPGLWGRGGPRPSADAASNAALARTLGASGVLPPGGTREVTFLLAWHYPNRRAWTFAGPGPKGGSGPDTVGNHYAARFRDAASVLRSQVPRLPALRRATALFVWAFCSSDISPAVREAALFNLSTLRSQTFFRTADGLPFGWEGCLDDAGSCPGSCTHVWNYDQATPFLFGGLARRMREIEYLHATGPDGAMSFRAMLPLDRARERPEVSADGQFGCVVKLYREWRLCGDDRWLARLWPACRRSLEFAWIPGGWDADQDGVCEGAQHVTMDVEYYGPNPVVQGWYLAALAAAAEMATAAADAAFAAACRTRLASGMAATEALFGDGYYRQRVVPPGGFGEVAPRLRHPGLGPDDPAEPEFQIGGGCAIDQLTGETCAMLAGLPPVFDDGHARAALASIRELNYVPDFGAWTNVVRGYAGRGERGWVTVAYPSGAPAHPAPYWSEPWTGAEYLLAAALALRGLVPDAEDVALAVRERFTGARRNPFDEAECGHHYARALASWGVVLALTGFGYDARSGVMSFRASDASATWFWSAGTAWGTLTQSPGEPPRFTVLHGEVRLTSIRIGNRDYPPPLAPLR